MMASLSRRRSVVKPLFFTAKALLAQHDLASVRTGGVDSVILLSMVSSFLEVGPSRSEQGLPDLLKSIIRCIPRI